MNSPNNLLALARMQVGVAADECMSKDIKVKIKDIYLLMKSRTCDLNNVCDKLSDVHRITHDPLVKTFLAKAIDLIDEIETTEI